MKKVFSIVLVFVVMFCTSCHKTPDNKSSNQLFTNSKKNKAINSKDIEVKLKNYYFDNYSSNDIGILADVTSDSVVDLITINESDNRITGNVYTFIDGQVKCIEEKTGGHDHASIFFNWYLLKNSDSTYSLIEELDGMWQGMGSCETIIYNLTNEGNRIINKQISVLSKDDKPIKDEDFTKYKQSISGVIGNSYEILCTYTQSSVNPKKIDNSLLIQSTYNKEKHVESKSSDDSSKPISGHPENKSSDVDVKNQSVLRIGRYKGEVPGAADLYAYITLESNHTFTLEANFELNSFTNVPPFTRKGKYDYTVGKSDDIHGPGTLTTWLGLYFDNEFYWGYAVCDDVSFQDQAIVFNHLD